VTMVEAETTAASTRRKSRRERRRGRIQGATRVGFAIGPGQLADTCRITLLHKTPSGIASGGDSYLVCELPVKLPPDVIAVIEAMVGPAVHSPPPAYRDPEWNEEDASVSSVTGAMRGSRERKCGPVFPLGSNLSQGEPRARARSDADGALEKGCRRSPKSDAGRPRRGT
jgi:hypothetical protein